eukprot:5861297-Pyramimonas_sp.AAC.1
MPVDKLPLHGGAFLPKEKRVNSGQAVSSCAEGETWPMHRCAFHVPWRAPSPLPAPSPGAPPPCSACRSQSNLVDLF